MFNTDGKKVILASTSPRRKLLLSKMVSSFTIIAPQCEETEVGTPTEIAVANARIKGEAVKDESFITIACDTLVALDGKVYGKPHTEENAKAMLKSLQGRTHKVISGLYVRSAQKTYLEAVESNVTIKPLTEEDIARYVHDYSPLDKAGSYGIQDGEIVASCQGDYDNIVGLPTGRLEEILGEIINVKY